MKRSFLVFLLILFHFQLSAQKSSSTYKVGENMSLAMLLDIGTAYIPENNNLLIPDLFNVKTGRPSTVNLYFFKPMALVGKYFMFKPGIGLGLDNYFFEKNLRFTLFDDSVNIDNASTRDYEKSKLSANYLDIPLEFRLATSENPAKGFKFEFGGKVGVLLKGQSKVKYEADEVTVKVKTSDNSLNRFRYGLTARMGYKRIMFFTYYALSPLFENDFASDINPLIFGITLSSI